MKLVFMILIILTAGVSFAASAARSSTSFRVGITIEHECDVSRTPDGGDISLACDAPGLAATHALSAGQAWPRASELKGASLLREVSESDQMRLIVVEY